MVDRSEAVLRSRETVIEGQKIVLGPVEARDSELLFSWINDPEIVHLHGPYRPVDAESHRQWLERLPVDPSTVVFAIRERTTRRLAGLVQLVDIHTVHRSAELRIRIGEANDRGKGWGTEAVELCCKFAFDDLGLTRVFLNVFADNAPAIGAYERAGFSFEGTMRNAAFIGGARKDVTVMGRLSDTTGAEFTEDGFRRLLNSLMEGGYRFTGYAEPPADRHVIWRHDVDMSVHRAAKLAELERQAGVKATYFLNPRSTFYNLLEPQVVDLVRSIISCGHQIGLHFDAGAFGVEKWSRQSLETAVAEEQRLLEIIVDQPIAAVSWHNPDLTNLLDFADERIGGLANAYSQRLRSDYVYASDSNGYWRFKPMLDVIAEGHLRLHLLTHPEWWTPTAMTARARVDRATTGRQRAVLRDQEALLKRGNRKQP
jgi:RimJ/RimL family protein N-acetyltransferase